MTPNVVALTPSQKHSRGSPPRCNGAHAHPVVICLDTYYAMGYRREPRLPTWWKFTNCCLCNRIGHKHNAMRRQAAATCYGQSTRMPREICNKPDIPQYCVRYQLRRSHVRLLALAPTSARGASSYRALGYGVSAHRAVNTTEGILRELCRRNSRKSGSQIQGCGEPPR